MRERGLWEGLPQTLNPYSPGSTAKNTAILRFGLYYTPVSSLSNKVQVRPFLSSNWESFGVEFGGEELGDTIGPRSIL